MSEFSNALREGAARMGVELDALALERLEAFHRLLAEKNEHMNLNRAAALYGYTDPNYVSRIYKKYYGKNITDA